MISLNSGEVNLSNIKIGMRVEFIDETDTYYHKKGTVVNYDYNSVGVHLDDVPDTYFSCGFDDLGII